MFASSSLEEVYHYVYYQLTSVALTMLDDVNGLSINFFSNEFIQAIVNFFTLFAWGLGLTGAAIAIMDFAVSYQTGGGGSFTGTGMNMLRLLVALLTFSSIPILLFQTSMDIYGTVRSVVVGSMDGATVSITDLVKGAVQSMFKSVYGTLPPVKIANGIWEFLKKLTDGFQATDPADAALSSNADWWALMPLFKKKAEMPTPEEIEAGKVKSYKDLIAPSVVSFRRSPGYYILGNTYRCVWAIRSYAETVEKDSPEIALLRELGESDGITLHIYTRHMPTVERDEIFHRAQNRTNMQKRSSYKLHEQIEADEQLTTLSRMIRETQRTKETFVYCAVFIELIADSLEHLQSKQIETQSILTHHKILVDKLYLRQLQGFESVKPNGKNAFGTEFERVFPASSVANLFPFSYSGKNDKNGFYIGRDQNGSNIIVDFDRRAEDKTNGHILILGNSGEGKSYLMKLIITNVIMAGKKVYILDPDNEYGELVKNLGGTYLDMMDSKYYINVLEPKTWVDPTQEINEFDDSPEAFKKQNRLSQHIAYLRDFFSVYQDFSSAQLDIIEIMLEETYKRRGITPRTDFTKLTSEDYPILSDLYRVIEEKLESYDEEAALAAKAGHPVMYSLEMLKSVGLGLRGICIGAMSRYFNGHTNIPNSNFIDFCVKDALTTNDNLKNAMFLNIFSYMSHKFLTEGSCDLFVDELHEFVKNRLAITYINSFMKRGRKKESGVCIGSQNVEDLLNPSVITYTKPLMSIPTHSFLFHPGANCDISEFQRTINVQPWEYEIIQTPNRGHCLYKCGAERYHLSVRAPEHKSALFGNAGGR